MDVEGTTANRTPPPLLADQVHGDAARGDEVHDLAGARCAARMETRRRAAVRDEAS